MATVVLMIVRNESEGIDRALESLTYQTDKDFKVIIIDDCSTDDTIEKIRQWQDKLDISINRLHDHWGLIEVAKHAINLIVHWVEDCDTIVRLDGDDNFLPHTIKALRAMWRPGTVVYGPYYEVSPGGCTIKTVKPGTIYDALACGVMMGVEDILKVGGLARDDVGLFIEYDLYARLEQQGIKFVQTDTPVYSYHRHQGSITSSNDRVQNALNKLEQYWGSELVSKIRSYENSWTGQ